MKVTLKPWTDEFKQDLIQIAGNVDRSFLSNRLPDPYTEESAAWYINTATEQEGNEGVYRAILADGEVAGTISVERKSDVYACDAEIGYFLKTELWSRGIMTKAIRQICELSFEKMNLLRITGLVYEPNIASRKALERNGFVQEGCLRNAAVKNGNVYNVCIYGKLRETKE